MSHSQQQCRGGYADREGQQVLKPGPVGIWERILGYGLSEVCSLKPIQLWFTHSAVLSSSGRFLEYSCLFVASPQKNQHSSSLVLLGWLLGSSLLVVMKTFLVCLLLTKRWFFHTTMEMILLPGPFSLSHFFLPLKSLTPV